MQKELLFQSLDTYKKLGAEHTSKEIVQQPELWQKVTRLLQTQRKELEAFISTHIHDNTKVIFTGAGTSEFVGNTVVPYLRKKGIQNLYSISTTNLVLSPKSYLHSNDDVLLVSCARSGNSPESVAAARIVEQVCQSTTHLIITCNSDGALAKISQEKKENSYLINIEAAHDLGFAMTGSFTSMTLCSALVFQLDILDNIASTLPAWCEHVEAYLKKHAQVIADLVMLKKNRTICLGSSGFNGIAQEAHLKILELSASLNTACFDTPLGFRHGPKSVLNDSSIVFMFMSSENYTRRYEIDMLKELMNTEGNHHVVAISPSPISQQQLHCHTAVYLPEAGDDCFHLLSSIMFAQAFSLENSIALGIRSDNPSPSGAVNRVVQGVTIYPY